MADWCIHAANLFYLLSFVGRDMLWLRTLTCCGLMFGLVFFANCTPAPMYGPMFWHVAFLVINIYQIHHLLVQRRRLALSRGQQAVSRELLEGMSDRELADSLAHAVFTPVGEVTLFTVNRSQRLTPDEEAFRDIAFNRLSRQELINLLSRRVWNSVKSMRPRWRKQPASLSELQLPL